MEKIRENHIADLIVECRNGKKSAQYQLFKRYFDSMFVVCNRIVSNQSDAEEVLQDAFVKVFFNLKKLKKPAAFGSWLKQTVINQSINFVKRSKQIKWEALPPDFAELNDDKNLVEQIDEKLVVHAVKQLPEGCRIVFVLHLVEGYKHHEIAKMLKISVSTSKSQYRRAKSILKVKLKQEIHE